MSLEWCLDNLTSIVLLAGVWLLVFQRRSLARPVNLLFFAALCLPFAEVLTVSAGMRLIATDWLALALLAVLIVRPSGRQMSPVQVAGLGLAASLAILPLFALPFFDSSDVNAAAIELDPARAGHLSQQPVDLYLSYGVQTLRRFQQCALLIGIVVVAGTARRWRRLVDWTIVGTTLNCLYGLYQASRFWLGWVDLPLLPFTYGRHLEHPTGYFRATGFMWEPTIFGSLTALALLLVLFRLTSAPSRRLWAVLVVHVLALVLSFSAIGILAGAAGWLIFVLASALGRGARSLRPLGISAAACTVVAVLAMSTPVRSRLITTMHKVYVTGQKVPSSRLERERAITVTFPKLAPDLDDPGLGIGQLVHAARTQLPLPLKIWVEQGVVGLVLFVGLSLTIAWHVWRVRQVRSGEVRAVTAALLVALGIVVLVQGAVEMNFVFFFGGLLLAAPTRETRLEENAIVPADQRSPEASQAARHQCAS